MQNFMVADNYAIDKAKRHVLFHHHQTLGWITLAKKERDGTWKQYHYQHDQMAWRGCFL